MSTVSISDEAYQVWLRESAPTERCILVELHHADGVLRLASDAYQTKPTDTPANIPYDDLLTDLPELLFEAEQSADLGDLEFTYPNFCHELIKYTWRGYTVRLLLGKAEWSYNNFRLLASGIIEKVTRPKIDRIKVEFTDLGYLLRQDVECFYWLDSTQETSIKLPACFGDVFNMRPVLLDPETLLYAANDGRVQGLVVRDNGVEVDFSLDAESGRFTLTNAPAGEITCDVIGGWLLQEESSTVENVTWRLIQRITPLSFENVKIVNKRDVGTVGLCIPADTDVTYQSLIDQLSKTIDGVIRFDQLGALQIIFIDYETPPDLVLTDDDVLIDSIQLSNIIPPARFVTLTYAPNYAQLTNVAGVIDDKNPELAIKLQNTKSQIIVENSDYKIKFWADDITIDTVLSDYETALTELKRRAPLLFQQREVYTFTAVVTATYIKPGDRVEVKFSRWGVDAVGTVLFSERSPGSNRVDLEVLL
jgi:hypothetical protein